MPSSAVDPEQEAQRHARFASVETSLPLTDGRLGVGAADEDAPLPALKRPHHSLRPLAPSSPPLDSPAYMAELPEGPAASCI
jgi:hypothetical protein